MTRRIRGSLAPALLSVSVLATSCSSSHNAAFLANGISAASSNRPVAPSSGSSSTTIQPTVTAIPVCGIPINLGRWSTNQLASQMLVTSAFTNSLTGADNAVKSGVGGVVLMGNSSTSTLGANISKMNSLSSGHQALHYDR